MSGPASCHPSTFTTSSATCGCSNMRWWGMDEPAGAWLRLTALTTAAGSLAVVVSAAAGLGLAHRVLAGLTIAPAIAVAVVAWWWRPALRTAASGALALLLAAAGAGALIGAAGDFAVVRAGHVVLAALAFAAACVVVLRTGRPTIVQGSLLDHITLTKPRIMVLL